MNEGSGTWVVEGPRGWRCSRSRRRCHWCSASHRWGRRFGCRSRVRGRVDGGGTTRDLGLRRARGRGRDLVDRRVGSWHRFDPGDQTGHTLIEHHDGVSWTVIALSRRSGRRSEPALGVTALAADDAWAVGSFGGEQPHPDARRALGRLDVDPGEEPERRSAGDGELSGVAALAADDVWAVGALRTRCARPDPHRALGRHGMDDRAEPEQGSVPELPVGRRGRRSGRRLGGRDVVHEGVRRPDADPPLGRHGLAPCEEPERRAADGGERPRVGFAVATDDVWAVGVRGLHTLTMHWDGSRVVDRPEPDARRARRPGRRRGPRRDDIWAVGGTVDRKRTPSVRWSSIGTARAGRSWRARTRGRATTICGASRP